MQHHDQNTPDPHADSSAVPAGNERGASLVEYALLIALIMIIALVAVQFLGDETSTSFSESAESVGASIG